MKNYEAIQKHIDEARLQRSVVLGEMIASGIMSIVNFSKTTKGKLALAAIFIVLGSGYALTHSFNNFSVSSAVNYPLFAVR